MPNLIDLTGRKFGRLLVIRRSGTDNGRVLWECVCDCGSTHVAKSYGLQKGNTTSCGCLTREKRAAPRTHGMSGSPTHLVWCAMKTRCTNPNVDAYANYGGRGITICERWLLSFENFLADMGQRPSIAHTIERIDVNGNYEPGNCCWLLASAQANNTTRSVRLEYQGVTLTLTDWAQRTGIEERVLSWRVISGWSAHDTLTTKPRLGNRRHPRHRQSDGRFGSKPAT